MRGANDELDTLILTFNRMIERLEASFRQIKQFSTDVSHELRSPLARLNVALELARDEARPESASALDRAELESRRLNALIGELLSLSQMEALQTSAGRQNVNLGTLIEDLMPDLLYEAGLVAEAARDLGRSAIAADGAAGAAMASDHRRILATAIGRLRGKIKYRPVVFELMMPAFTLLQLQRTVEALSGVRLHKQNFRRLVEQQGLVEETGQISAATGGRPARLVRFRREVLLERPAPGLRLRAARRATG